MNSELLNISAKDLVRHLKNGDWSCLEVVEHYIDKIEKENPRINAVVVKLFEEAIKDAKSKDLRFSLNKNKGKIYGLPFTVKECLDLIGTPSTFGLLRRQKDFPKKTDPYILALQKEGGIAIGKTNVSQLLAAIESQNPVYGTTNNPFSLKHTAGGSSGGEAAIISTGGSPIGLGTDIGGSSRIPAAFSGICSIKPTLERTIDQSRYSTEDIDFPIKSVTGIMANFGADLDLFLDIINQAGSNDDHQSLLKPFQEVDFSQLKVGYYISDNIFEPVDQIKRAVLNIVEKLKSLGVNTIPFLPPNLIEAEELYTKILSADNMAILRNNLKDDQLIKLLRSYFQLASSPKILRSVIEKLAALLGQSTIKRIIPYIEGKGKSNLAKLQMRKIDFTKDYFTSMQNTTIGSLDAIISPVFPLPGLLHNTSKLIGLGGTYAIQSNLTGFPSGVATISKATKEENNPLKNSMDIVKRIAVKNEKEMDGLPIAIQITSKPFDDHIVIALIEELHTRIKR